MLKKLFLFFSSVKLAIAIFIFSMILIVIGTIDQRTHGIFYIMDKYFYTWIVYTENSIPYFLGGYFWGWLLFFNMILGTIRYVPFRKEKIAIYIIHFGFLLLLLGTFITSVSQVESNLAIAEGKSKNYSQSQYRHELVFINKNTQKTISIDENKLKNKKNISINKDTQIIIEQYFRNSVLKETQSNNYSITQGIGKDFNIIKQPYDTSEKTKPFASIIVKIIQKNQPAQRYLFSSWFNETDIIKLENTPFEVSLRHKRYYLPFSIKLVDFAFDRYRGTSIPRNFSSEIIIEENGRQERKLIYMNAPLRKAGKTFYQASFFRDEKGTILHVVDNKGWLIPYISTLIISLGMLLQFLTTLIKFLKKRKPNA